MKNLIKTSPPPYTRVRGIIVPAFAAVAGLLFPAVTYADGFDPAEARIVGWTVSPYGDSDHMPLESFRIPFALLRQTVAQFNEKGGQSQEILSKFSTSARFSLIEDRQEWGEMHLVVDGDTVWRQTDKDHITTPILTFPVDGNRHSVAFCWPAMGPDARIEFTTDDDSTDELKDIYCIELEMTGASSSSINEVEVVYTTDKGDEKTLYFGSLENDDWGTGSDQPLRSAMRNISEADSIVSLKAYDRVEEGMEHRVAVPCRITRPQHAVPVREFMPVYVSESLPDHLNGYGLNYSSVRMISDAELHLSLMDASDGKAISDGVSFSSGSPTADGEGWLFDSESKDGFPEIGTIIKADNYVPIVITNISNTARRAYINGNEYQISGDRIQATVPMYPDKNPGWQFLPLYCVTPSESDADNTTDRYRAYDGEILSVEYDGSNTNEQIRHLKLCVLNRSGKELTSENTTAVAFTDGGYMVFDVTSSDNNTLLLETTDNCPYDGGQEGNLTIFFADKDEWTAYDGDFDHFSESWIKDFFHVKNTGQSLDKYDGTEFNVPTASADPNSVDLSAAGDMGKAIKTLSITLPQVFPFTLSFRRDRNGVFVRGILAVNWVPGGGTFMSQFSDTQKGLLKTANFFDNTWNSIMNYCDQHDDKPYTPDERLFDFPTFFRGIKGWMEARVWDNEEDQPTFQLNAMGIKGELSGSGTYKVPLVFGSAGLSMKFEESIELSHVIPVNYLDNPYFRLANVTDVNVSASVEAGINLWIARAAAGIRGGVSARFDAAAQWDPSSIYGSTLSNNKAGIKFRLNAFLQAYAEARFLFWSKRWEHTIASIDHTWYVPDSDFNPFKNPDTPIATTRLRSSIYRPFRIPTLPDGCTSLLKDVDAYATPRYLFGGSDLAYIQFNPDNLNKMTLNRLNGGQWGEEGAFYDMSVDTAPDGYGLMAALRAGDDVDIHDGLDPNSPEGAETVKKLRSGKKLSVVSFTKDGNLHEPVDINVTASYLDVIQPVAAVSDSKSCGAVIWKEGSYSYDTDDVLTGGVFDGDFLFSIVNQDGTYSYPRIFAENYSDEYPVMDYSLAMRYDSPVVFATVLDKYNDSIPRLAAYKPAEDVFRLTEYSGVSPRIVSVAGRDPLDRDERYLGAALRTLEDGGKDLSLFDIDKTGHVNLILDAGLGKRGIIDFKLIKQKQDADFNDIAIIWREANVKADTVSDSGNFQSHTSLYASRLCMSDNGKLFLSTPTPVIVDPANGDFDITVLDYDGYFKDFQITAAAVVTDLETLGAEIIEGHADLRNEIKIEDCGLKGGVEEGKDPVYYFRVMNAGVDPIDHLDITVNSRLTNKTVSILPGYSTEVTATMPWGDDVDDVTYEVRPSFTTTTPGGDNIETTRKPARKRQLAPAANEIASGSMKLHLSDIAVETRSAVTSGDSLTVIGCVFNHTPVPLRPGFNVKVGLYTDPSGFHPYAGVRPVTIDGELLSDPESGHNRSTTLAFNAEAPEDDVTLYIVVHTVTDEGTAISDMRSFDNTAMVNVKGKSPGTSMETVTNSAEATFTVDDTADGVVVKGLEPGDCLRVFKSSGLLVKWIDNVDSPEIRLSLDKGIYVISNLRSSVKHIRR